jgi:hypothetical protein
MARGRAIPLADIEDGLYNNDYFATSQKSDPQDSGDRGHGTFKSKKLVSGNF